MLFNSYIFIFLFLPFTLISWYMLNKRKAFQTANIFLIIMSLCFYGYFNFNYLLIILISIFFNYLISFLLDSDKIQVKKSLLFTGIAGNLAILFYFKYFDFFIENFNTVFRLNFQLKYILLPLGISFFTFQQLSFIIDRYKGKAKHYSLIYYMMFVTFFPQLIAGPIVLHHEIIPQFKERTKRKYLKKNVEKGIVFFVIGLGKKVLLADTLAIIVNFGYDQVYFLDTPTALLIMVAYTFELYFDFSGYCDMAMGIGKMFNIDLPSNFNSPYQSCSIKELWARWHMTLSRFLKTYIYFPLGGSRKGKLRTILNTMIVFTVSGLWHGANWTFVVWGIIQGLFVSLDSLNIFGVRREDGKPNAKILVPKYLSRIITFLIFSLSLIFFRSSSMDEAAVMIKNIFVWKETGYLTKAAIKFELPELYLIKQILQLSNPEMIPYLYAAAFVLLLFICLFIITRKNTLAIVSAKSLTSRLCWMLVIIFVWSVISFSQVSTFIYFNF